jgi:SAM-dependent methyltransferase
MSSFKDHFSGVASAYAANRPLYPPALGELLASRSPGRALAWDAGCGSGQLSTLLAGHFDRVIATDASPQQIEQAQPHAGVEYRVAPAEVSGLPDGIADLCVAAQAAHWFDLERYYAEVRRVARPNGVVALVTYGNMSVDGVIEDPWERLVETIDHWWPAQRALVDDLYAGLPFPFGEERLQPLEMTARWTLRQMLGYADTWSSGQAFVRERGRPAFEALLAPLRAAWGDPEEVREVRWPLGGWIGPVSAGG